MTNGHSKKVANHAHMVALYTLFYNFIRTHSKLKMTPAMQAVVASTFLSFDDMLARIDSANVPTRVRGPYKKRLPQRRISGTASPKHGSTDGARPMESPS